MQTTEAERELSLLSATAEAANRAMRVDEAMYAALEEVCRFTGWPVGHGCRIAASPIGARPPNHLWHVRGEVDLAALADWPGAAQTFCETATLAPLRELARPVWVRDAPGLRSRSWEAAPRSASLLAGPILAGGRVVGVIEFLTEQACPANPRWLDLIGRIASQLSAVADREGSYDEMLRKEEYFRRLTENALDIITILNADGTIRFESASVEHALGYKPEDYVGKSAFEFVHPDDLERVAKAFEEALQRNGNTPPLTFRFRHRHDGWRTLEGVGNNLLADPVVRGIVFNSRDITERVRLEEQYLKSQKVAAVGLLAGGVAHDFNNILTAIMGYNELLLREFSPGHPFYGNLAEIKRAADRAAGLTGQLLALSRKQVLEPKIVCPRSLLAGMEKMLRRLAGETIEFVLAPDSEPGRVRVDPSQLEQVFMNLAVNARDAMAQGGRLTIETRNVPLDQEYARSRPELVPGDYVMVAVSDTGCGMGDEIQSHLFEPFFTTKEKGRGSGLGLATCYGIIKQSGGHIAIYSEPKHGTTVKIYLPRVQGEAEAPVPAPDFPDLPAGSETILVVEDEPVLRELAALILRECGYTVLESATGEEALRTARRGGAPIHLVMTDVIMPGMGGKQLAGELREACPATRILFCSGYTEEAVLQHGVLTPGIHFLQKPFTPSTLARKVRGVLDGA